MPKHRWEADGDDEAGRQAQAPCSEASHSWDTLDAALSAPMPPVPAAFSDDEDMEEVDPAHSPEEAADTFAQVLLEHYYDSSLSAKAVCTLAYDASVAGMPGLVQELAVKPQKAGGGNYNRHLREVLGFHNDFSYKLTVPGKTKHAVGRTDIVMGTQPLHELLAEEMEEDPEYFSKLNKAFEDDVVPPAFFQHPLVASGGLVVPFVIYMDGVAYAINDTVVGIWAYSFATTRRHLVALVRKKLVCACGCLGWCSFWPVMQWLHWSCQVLFDGVFPSSRHDGSAWLPSDAERAKRGGSALPARAALVALKGDWGGVLRAARLPNLELRPQALLLLLGLLRPVRLCHWGGHGDGTLAQQHRR